MENGFFSRCEILKQAERLLLILYGLPGAGKSTLLMKYHEQGFVVYDDFMMNAVADSSDFKASRHFEELIHAIQHRQPCIIVDIRFCEQSYRDSVKTLLYEYFPDLQIQWHCMDCTTPLAIEHCRNNVHYSAPVSTRNSPRALQLIDELAPVFSVEPGTIIHQVVNATHSGE